MLLRAAARAAADVSHRGTDGFFAGVDERSVREVAAGDPDAVLAWRAGVGWTSAVEPRDPRHAALELYLPFCSATPSRPVVLGHLGQSLDGFIATHEGESHWITGQENLRHMHRLRALCDAVVVGAGTVAADNPQLTTRMVDGTNPLRVVLDPGRRLGAHYRVFTDGAADTLYVCARSLVRPGEAWLGGAAIASLPGPADAVDPTTVVAMLRARGCSRVFVEGGGATVSAFVEAHALDRLQVTIAPIVIGSGRPAIRLVPPAVLGECRRPPYRVFRMGGDILFDCDLRAPQVPDPSPATLARVI